MGNLHLRFDEGRGASSVLSYSTGSESGAVGRRKRLPHGDEPAQSSGKVEAVEVHHLVPGGHEVMHELLRRVAARIDFREGP